VELQQLLLAKVIQSLSLLVVGTSNVLDGQTLQRKLMQCGKLPQLTELLQQSPFLQEWTNASILLSEV